MIRFLSCFVLCAILPCAAALADDADKPYTVIVPQGMTLVQVGSRCAICPPADVPAVRQGLADVAPSTQPTTQPSDLLAHLASQHDSLSSEISADLLIPSKTVNDFLDTKLKKIITQMADVNPRCYMLVCSEAEVTTAVKQGWHAPLFYYNRVADHVFFNPQIIINTTRQADDLVVWTETRDGELDTDISAAVSRTSNDLQESMKRDVSDSTINAVTLVFQKFIADSAATPLKLPPSEQWFGRGVITAMSCKYTAELTGIWLPQLQQIMSMERGSHFILASQLNLLTGIDPSSVRPEYLPYYDDAVERKAGRVVEKLLAKDPAAVTKLLTAIHASLPPDNLALVSLIRQTTGIDVTDDLLPN